MKITLKHGSGGEESGRLIKDIFASVFDDEILLKMEDSAVLPPAWKSGTHIRLLCRGAALFQRRGYRETFRLRYGE